MKTKTGFVIAAAAAVLAAGLTAGCATQTDSGVSPAAPGVAQTSCGGYGAKDRMSCKARTHHKKMRTSSAQQQDQEQAS